MSKLLVDEISDADNTGPVTVTDGAVVNRTGDGTIIDLQSGGTTVGSIGTYSNGTFEVIAETVNFHLRPNGGTTSTGNVVWSQGGVQPWSDGYYNVGASSYRWKDLYLSSGVYLGGTGSANHLDDYEEGTWTPNQGGGLTVGGTFSSNGRYTKVGNLVTVCGLILGSSVAVSAIGVICTNLPFSIAEISTIGIATGAWTGSNSATFISLGATTTLYSAQAISGATNISFTHTYRV